jgi:hypothetical protein
VNMQRQRQEWVEIASDTNVEAAIYELIHGEPGSFGLNYTIGFLNRWSVLELGVVFHNYYPSYGQIELSMAGFRPNSLTWRRLAAIIDVSASLGVRMVVSRVAAENTPVIRLLEACGGKVNYLLDLRGEGKDEAFVTMKIEDLKRTKYWSRAHGR